MQVGGKKLAGLLCAVVLLSSLVTYTAVGSKNNLVEQSIFTFLDKAGFKTASSGEASAAQLSSEQEANLRKIDQVYALIKKNYLEKVDDQKLIDGAISGMLNVLDDPYTVYMDQNAAAQFTDTISSSFQGIGAEVNMEGGKVTIVSPFKGSPAEKSGLRPKDQILSVNGEKLEGLDLYQAVLKIRGPKGSKATLEISRPGVTENMAIEVTRDDIPIETVYSEVISKGGKRYGKIEVTQFSTETATHFKEQLEKMEKENVDGVVIDLRGDPGGLLNIVVEMANQIIPNKGAILQVEDASGNRETINSTYTGKKGYPITVLVDKGSASASEILAGALKENGYPVVGQVSFGKGTVQNTVELSDKSQVKMTIAKWLTPNGTWIHKKGIEPTVAIEQPKYFTAAPINLKEGSLKQDQSGDAIKNAQLILDGLGFPSGRSDGYFDDRTATAVKSFQKLNNLSMTGVIDTQTANLMQEQLVKKIKDPVNDLQLQAALQVLEKESKK